MDQSQLQPAQVDFFEVIKVIVPMVVLSWAIALAVFYYDMAVDMKA